MVHRKVALKNIKTLTFHADQLTSSRRTSPIPQLTCIGKPCLVFQPEVVQCSNMGDDGLGNVQWSCETDLPSGLRLGKVDVSCEGWTAAGDKNVLQGSCGLEYNLHRTNAGVAYGDHPHLPSSEKVVDKVFSWLLWIVTIVLLYSLIRSLLVRLTPRWAPPGPSSFFPWGGGGGGGGGGQGGGGGGGIPWSGQPPPPYSKDVPDNQPIGGRGFGFWTGLTAGGAAGYVAANARRRGSSPPHQVRERYQRGHLRDHSDDDRGVGSSTGLGEMRRATGFGGSSTR